MALVLITGLADETAALRKAGVTAAIRCSGSSAERAAQAARDAIAAGATALMSIGVAGGLAPGLRPGDVVLASGVMLPDGRRLDCAAAWLAALKRRVPDAHVGLVAGSAEAASTPQAKRALHQAGGALAVDMESHAVALAAAAAALPFLALRVISDTAGDNVPAYALAAVDAEGRSHVLPVLRGLLRQPWTLPRLIRLGRDFHAALAGLDHTAAAAPDFAFSPPDN